MALHYEVLEDTQLVRIHISGAPTSEQMLHLVDEILADTRLHTGFALLSDHREIDHPATPEQVKAILARVASHANERAPSRMAVLVATSASYGMMRMMSATAAPTGFEVQPFYEEVVALAWLRQRALPE